MPISRTFAAAQLKRFSKHPGFDGEKAPQLELIKALEDSCDQDEQVRNLIEYLMRTITFAPLPANIHQAAEAVAESRRYEGDTPSPKKPPCSECRGSGWAAAWELVTWDEERQKQSSTRITKERYMELRRTPVQNQTVQEIAVRCQTCARARKASA